MTVSLSSAPKEFVTRDTTEADVDPQCCKDAYVGGCFAVDVDPEVMDSGSDIIILDRVLSFSNMIPPRGHVYSNHQGDEAIFR